MTDDRRPPPPADPAPYEPPTAEEFPEDDTVVAQPAVTYSQIL
jgi:hypothetical protein